MIFVYIGGIIISAVLIVIAIIAIAWVSNSVSSSIRMKTLALISSYDEIIEDKSIELSKLSDQISKLNEEKESLEEDDESIVIDKPVTVPDNNALKAVERFTNSDYNDNSLSSNYQAIRSAFSINLQDLINSIPRDNSKKVGLYEKFLNELSFKTVQDLSTLDGDSQYSLLKGSIDKDLGHILDVYAKDKDVFNILDFYTYLKQKASSDDSIPILRVGPTNIPKNIPDGIKIEIDPEIVEGYQYISDNVLYDYAIKSKEIS